MIYLHCSKQFSDSKGDEFFNLYNQFENFEELNDQDEIKVNKWRQDSEENMKSLNEKHWKVIIHIIG